VIVLGFTGRLVVARGGGGVLSTSQATSQMLELAIRPTSNPSAAPPAQDTFGVSLSAAPDGGSSRSGEPAGGAEMPPGEQQWCRDSWASEDGSCGGVPRSEEGGGDARSHVLVGVGLVQLRRVPDASGESLVPFVCETAHTGASNADEATPAQVLGIYRYQPNLERRNHMLKGPQAVAPVFIENPHRIEAILLCHFLAMSAEALIEREIRNSMRVQGLTGIPLYPELRKCPSPSAPRILKIFADAQRHHLVSKGEVVQDFDPELTPFRL